MLSNIITTFHEDKMITKECELYREKLSSDVVILILEFYGGLLERVDCESISMLIKNCFGRFSDESIKFLFRYGTFNTNNTEQVVFLYREQYRLYGNSTVENQLVYGLCGFTNHSNSMKKIQELEKFNEENRQECLLLKKLNFFSTNTSWEVIAKSFEVFPNFESLVLGFRQRASMRHSSTFGKPYYTVEKDKLALALQTSNKKCKSFTCFGHNMLKGDVALHFPLLEEYELIGSGTLKEIKNIESMKNLKSLNYKHHDDGSYQVENNIPKPSFFQSLAKCEQLTRLHMPDTYIFGEEFTHLKNCLPNLTYLNLAGCNAVGKEIFEAIGTFHSLKTLITCLHHEDESWEELLNLKQLEYLEALSFINFKALKVITQMNTLKSLTIDSLFVTFEEGKILTNLKNLERFSFTSGPVEHPCQLILYLYEHLHVKQYEFTYDDDDDRDQLVKKIKDIGIECDLTLDGSLILACFKSKKN